MQLREAIWYLLINFKAYTDQQAAVIDTPWSRHTLSHRNFYMALVVLLSISHCTLLSKVGRTKIEIVKWSRGRG